MSRRVNNCCESSLLSSCKGSKRVIDATISSMRRVNLSLDMVDIDLLAIWRANESKLVKAFLGIPVIVDSSCSVARLDCSGSTNGVGSLSSVDGSKLLRVEALERAGVEIPERGWAIASWSSLLAISIDLIEPSELDDLELDGLELDDSDRMGILEGGTDRIDLDDSPDVLDDRE